MREKLTVWLPHFIIVLMAKITGKSKLTEREKEAQQKFIENLHLPEKNNGYAGKIVAMVGLIGSGKSRIAQALAKEVPAIIVEGDAVRIRLREAGAGYDRAWKICENTAIVAAGQGVHVVVDADYIAAEKRASLNQAAKKAGIDVIYLRTICDFDVMIGRMMASSYPEHSFFGGASTIWQGTADQRGAVIKIRELIMRLASHYEMEKTKYPARYQWVPRIFSFVDFIVNTTDEKKWPKRLEKIAKQIRLR